MEIKPLMKDKKGMSIGDLYPAILTIGIVAILIAVVMIILVDFGTNVAESSPIAGAVTNETYTTPFPATGTAISLQLTAENTNCSAYNFAITAVENQTGNYAIDSANYSVNSDTGVVLNLTGTFIDDWLITYSWSYGGDSCVVTEDIVDDLTDFIPWIGVILLIIAAAIVLGILIRNLGNSGSSRV